MEEAVAQPIIEAPDVVQNSLEKPSPYDWVDERDITVGPNSVTFKIDDPEWSTFTNTNSMDPVIDEGVHAIQKRPKSESDIHVGDIVSYIPENYNGVVIHRVVEIGDDGAWYAYVKGDNNPYRDPQKVRFAQIQRVLVAIIY